MSCLCALSACPAKERAGRPGDARVDAQPGDASKAKEAPPREVETALLDTSVKPCEDFYQYACGGWLARAEIPPDEATWDRSFHVIEENVEQDARAILESLAHPEGQLPALPADEAKRLGDYYSACMDEKAVQGQGLTPLKALLEAIDGVQDLAGLSEVLGQLHRYQVWTFFDWAVDQDFKDPKHNLFYLDQSGLGLPDRDYYLKRDAASRALLREYQKHVARVLELGGASKAEVEEGARAVLQIEHKLAEIAQPEDKRRDPWKTYNKMSRADLARLSPAFPWASYLGRLGAAQVDSLSISSLDYFRKLHLLWQKTRAPQWRAYLRWQLLSSFADTLPRSFVEEDFKLSALITGIESLPERWKRCVGATEAAMGESLGHAYVLLHFPEAKRQRARRLIEAIVAAFIEDLSRLDWMDATTRERALAKAQKMLALVAHPEKWKRYGFKVSRQSYTGNALAAAEFDSAYDLTKLGRPVDRFEWSMTPQTVNAAYDPLRNRMEFPAAILQEPFFLPAASDAFNLGALGMVVGHELTHGFDDEGSQFDAEGNLQTWWAPETRKRFEQKTRCIEKQYGSYESLPGLRLNGKLTLGENIADLGGAKLAFAAYRNLARSGQGNPLRIEGFNEDQRFFLAAAQAWCGVYREELARMFVRVDPHSPPRFRVNGVLVNMPEFAEAFACEVGTPMNPAKKCSVW